MFPAFFTRKCKINRHPLANQVTKALRSQYRNVIYDIFIVRPVRMKLFPSSAFLGGQINVLNTFKPILSLIILKNDVSLISKSFC